jgi:hypothetical protein
MRPARSADHWLATAPMRVAGIAAAIPGEGEDDDQLMCGGVDDRGECSGPDPPTAPPMRPTRMASVRNLWFGVAASLRSSCYAAPLEGNPPEGIPPEGNPPEGNPPAPPNVRVVEFVLDDGTAWDRFAKTTVAPLVMPAVIWV